LTPREIKYFASKFGLKERLSKTEMEGRIPDPEKFRHENTLITHEPVMTGSYAHTTRSPRRSSAEYAEYYKITGLETGTVDYLEVPRIRMSEEIFRKPTQQEKENFNI